MSSDQQNKNAFAERLKRIEQAQDTPRPQTPAKAFKKSHWDGVQAIAPMRARRQHRLRNTIIWCALIGMIGGGTYWGASSFMKENNISLANLSDEVGILGNVMSALSPANGLSQNQSQKNQNIPPREMGERGWVLRSPEVLTADHGAATMQTHFADFEAPTGNSALGEIVQFDPNPTCELRRPTQDEVIHNIRIGTAALSVSIQNFSNQQLAEALTDHVTGMTSPKPYMVGKRVDALTKAVDVIVTDTSKPVYLVLQSMGGNTLWNIQTAPDVQIAHIAMIGQNSGFVAPQQAPSFEALKITDFVTGHDFGADDTIRPCMIRPWRNPDPTWGGMVKAGQDNMLYVNQMHSFRMGYQAYNDWFTKTLGVDASHNVITADTAAHVIAGPLPDQLLEYQSPAGRPIYLTRNDHILTGPPDELAAAMDKLQSELLTAAIGGDDSLLTPPAMERATQ